MAKEIIFKSDFSELFYNNKNDLFIYRRFANEKYSNKVYQREAEKLAELTEKYKPSCLLLNNKEFTFSITPAIQEWVNNNIFPRLIKAGIKRGAFVVSEDLFAQVSIEQTMEEDTGKKLKTKFFDTEEEALKWLTK